MKIFNKNKTTTVKSENKRSQLKRNSISELLLGLGIIILINVIGAYFFFRLDLTSEKRYSLSDQTKELLKDVDDIVFIKVYLEGDFPAGFKRLSRETREMLNEFRAYSKNIEYEFINPSASEDKLIRNNFYKQLMEKGLEPTSLQVKDKEGSKQQIIFPGAIISYKGQETAIQLLKTKIGVAPEEQLNNSVQNLEYELTNAIKKLSITLKKRVAFIEGHGELDKFQTGDITDALKEYYTVDRVTINGKLKALDTYNAIIIAQPDTAINDKDKFIIDQFIMRGGKVLWLIDPLYASLDSLRSDRNEALAYTKNLGLDFQLFDYGVKIKNDLVQDLNALPIPIQTGVVGGKPQFDYFPWYYFPLAEGGSNHPIVKNIELIRTDFVSSIDTNVNSSKVKKTVLLLTSPNSFTEPAPVYISLDIMKRRLDERKYSQGQIPLAVLLEGTFRSHYTKDVLPDNFLAVKDSFNYKESSINNRMIIISDGDIIKNQTRRSPDGQIQILPLGYDMFSHKVTNTIFGNKTFIMNCMNYLLDDSNLMSTRSKELKLRLLDKNKIEKSRQLIQLINVILPLLLVIVAGFVFNFLRKKYYTKK